MYNQIVKFYSVRYECPNGTDSLISGFMYNQNVGSKFGKELSDIKKIGCLFHKSGIHESVLLQIGHAIVIFFYINNMVYHSFELFIHRSSCVGLPVK